MRISYKLGFMAAATLAGANAFAAIDLPQTGNGELVLFVQDVANPARVYERGLGVHIDDVMTTAQAASASYAGEPTEFSRNISDVSADATLTTFLSGGSSFVWTVMAGDSKIVGSSATKAERRYLTTVDPNLLLPPFQISNSLITSNFSGLDSTLLSANGNTFSATDSLANGAFWGTGDQSETWYGSGLNNQNIFPSSGTSSSILYILANSSTSGSAGALVWQLSSAVTMDAQGNLSFGATTEVPQVPVPAAVWLLGSALAGLATVRRRRVEAAAIAA